MLIIVHAFGVWRSLVSRLVRDQEAAGSSPATPTIKETSFVYQGKRGFLLLSGQNTGAILKNRAAERSSGCYGARFYVFSGRNSPKTLVY